MTLHEIQQQLKAPKTQFNKFGGYHYRNAEDILEAVKPLLGNSVLTLSDEVVQLGDRYYVKATATFKEMPLKLQGETKQSVTAYAREADERKGMDASQITGAASSYARKYALNGLFLIDDTKDADHDDHSDKPEKPVAKKPERTPDKERIKSLLSQLGHKPLTVAGADEITRKLTDLPYKEEHYGDIIGRLEALIEEQNQQ